MHVYNEYYHLADDTRLPDGTYLRVDRDAYKPVSHADGYYVAYTDHHSPKSTYTVTDPSQFLEATRRVMTDDGYLGVWTDGTGTTWVEQSFWVENEFAARALGKTWHQIAIWDCANDREVIL